tara:strand:+ start:49 stop:648 length:600 start_codon:yes stop_codon:yes gene_type:complete
MLLSLFPTIIHTHEVTNFKNSQKNLIEFIYEEREKDDIGIIASNGGGWHSKRDYHQKQNNILYHIVKSAIKTHFSDKEIFKENLQIEISALWANINGKGNYNVSHIHPNSDISGVLWIKIPENSGVIEFTSPHMYNQFRERQIYKKKILDNAGIHPAWYLTPIEGNIVFFPSSIFHNVNSNESEEDRISVSFNLNIINI